MPHEHQGLQLFGGLQGHAYHDQHAGGAEGVEHGIAQAKQVQQHCRDNGQAHEEEGAEQGQAVADLHQVIARGVCRAGCPG